MADMKAYSLIALAYDSVLYPVETLSVAPGITEMLNGGGASTSATIAALMDNKPIITFGTPALAVALAKFGQMFAIESGKFFTLYYGQRETGGTFVAGSTVITLTINEGAIFLKSVSASQGQHAIATYDIYATYDGTLLPIVYLLAAAPTDAILSEKFTLGPVKITTAQEVQGVTIDMNQTVMNSGHSGSPYALIAAVTSFEPTVTIQTFDAALIGTLTTIGKVIEATTIYFRKFDPALGRAADATATNISFVISDAFAFWGGLSGDRRADADMQITLRPYYDGTNAVFEIDTATAIT